MNITIKFLSKCRNIFFTVTFFEYTVTSEYNYNFFIHVQIEIENCYSFLIV